MVWAVQEMLFEATAFASFQRTYRRKLELLELMEIAPTAFALLVLFRNHVTPQTSSRCTSHIKSFLSSGFEYFLAI